MMRIALAFALFAVTACGSVAPSAPDAAPADARPIDAPDTPIDGRDPDAPAATGEVHELMPAAGRVTGGGLVLDVELGHAITQNPTTGGGRTLEGGAAIKP